MTLGQPRFDSHRGHVDVDVASESAQSVCEENHTERPDLVETKNNINGKRVDCVF